MDDLISRQAAIDALYELFRNRPLDYGRVQIRGDVLMTIENIPSAERHGKWEIADDMPRLDNTFSIRCSLCGQLMLAHPNDENPNFCCNCGAKMVEVEE